MTYDLLKSALDVSALRQETISSNISNVNTPDYKANRVAFEDYLQRVDDGTALKRTHSSHLPVDSKAPVIQRRNNTTVQDNGNNVDIEYEMAELSANNIYYDAIVSQLNAKYAMMRSVMR